MAANPATESSLDLSWLNLYEDATSAEPGKKGLTLKEINLGRYADTARGAGDMTYRMRGAVPRPGAHPSATLDDLITLASQASTRAKRSAEGIVVHLPERSEIAAPRGPAADAATAAEPPVRLVVDSYSVDRRDREVAVTVAIRARDVTHKATSLRGLDEIDLALATATADCIASFAPAHLQLRVDAIRRLAYGEHRVVMVVVTWRDPEGEEQQLVGAGLEREDAHRGVINAVLDATNRRLGYWATLRPTVPARRRRVRQRA